MIAGDNLLVTIREWLGGGEGVLIIHGRETTSWKYVFLFLGGRRGRNKKEKKGSAPALFVILHHRSSASFGRRCVAVTHMISGFSTSPRAIRIRRSFLTLK